MKAYHTYNAIDVAFCLLKYAKEQGKCFTNLQLQKLVYVAHGLSLAYFQRPLILDDVLAWKYGPVIPSVYFGFKKFGSSEVTDYREVMLDSESEGIVRDVAAKLGHLTGEQLIELTHRSGTPWSKTWDGTHQRVIKDSLIKEHYDAILKSGRARSL